MQDNPKGYAQQKKPYKKPEVNQVPLKPEEAVLGACKNASQAGPGQGACNAPLTCGSLGT